MTEEPLHVQVERAMGVKVEFRKLPIAETGDKNAPKFWQRAETVEVHDKNGRLKEHAEVWHLLTRDWVRDGWAEILERERYSLRPASDIRGDKDTPCVWDAYRERWESETGQTPGEAVCRLFVRLHAEKEAK